MATVRKARRKTRLLHVPVPGKDYTLNLPKDHLSYSQVDLYRRCPEKYYRHYVLGEKEPTTVALVEGLVMSKCLEKSNLHRAKTGEHLCLSKVIKLHGREAKKGCRDLPGDGTERGISCEEIITRGINFLTKFWGPDEPDVEPAVIDGKPGAELEIKLEFGGIPFICVPDLIEEICVLDFKVVKSTRFLKAESDLQLSLYAVATSRTKVGYIVFCKKNGKIEWLTGERDLKRTRRWCDIVVGRVAFGISMGVFPPTDPSSDFLCNPRWCHWWDTCYGACS